MDKRPVDTSKKKKNFFVIATVFGVTLLGIWWAQKLYTQPVETMDVKTAAQMSILSDYTTPPDVEIAAPIYETSGGLNVEDDEDQNISTDEAFEGADESTQISESTNDYYAEEQASDTPTTEFTQVDFNDEAVSGAENAIDPIDSLSTSNVLSPSYSPELDNLGENLTVQAVLTSVKSAVISGSMDGVILSMPFDNGEKFNEGDVLVEYRCDFERARVSEMQARFRLSRRQVEALDRLQQNNTMSEVEYLSAVEQNEQNRALLEQAQAVERRCTIYAPFNGRVMDREANAFEASRSGRVLMQIGSTEPLQAELLIPSEWLKWINVGTPAEIYVNESGRNYAATITRVHGEIDPVSRTAHVVARLDTYQEELLPGMSGRATFRRGDLNITSGFLGLNLGGRP